MKKIQLFFYYFYSFLFCLRYLPFCQAIHIPVLIHPSVKIDNIPRGSISFFGKIKHSMLIFGFDGTKGQSNCQSLISIAEGGRFLVGDTVSMAKGTRLIVGNNGTIKIGSHFWCNGDSYFCCTSSITIGDDNMYGWNISFNTSDGHHVYENGVEKPMEGNITIGNHVWIASHCIIGKNTIVADGSLVSQHSLLSKAYNTSNSLIGGIPAKILKENYSWKE